MNEAAKKKLLQMIPHALYVLTTQAHGKTAASTMSWVNQASFKPPMISVGVKKDTFTFEVLKESKAFVLNYLGEGQKDIAQKFFKRSEEHTSELQSPDHLVCRLLLEKKKPTTSLHALNES